MIEIEGTFFDIKVDWNTYMPLKEWFEIQEQLYAQMLGWC